MFSIQRRVRLLLLVVMAVGLAAAGCGDDDAADPGTDLGSPTPGDGQDALPDEPLGGGPYPIADLTVSVTHPDFDAPQVYRVSCLGDTATITGADLGVSDAAACLAIADDAAQDRLVDGPIPEQVCTQQFGGPDVAEVSGTNEGQQVDTLFSRTDGCEIADWSLMSGFLPAPRAF